MTGARRIAAAAAGRAGRDRMRFDRRYRAYLDDEHDWELVAMYAEVRREVATVRREFWSTVAEHPWLVAVPPVFLLLVRAWCWNWLDTTERQVRR